MGQRWNTACHTYPTLARRWANGGIPPATCHPYPTHMTNIYLSQLNSMHLASAQVIHSSYVRRNVVFINVLKLFFDISSGAEQAHLFHSFSILYWGDLFCQASVITINLPLRPNLARVVRKRIYKHSIS